LVVRGAVSVSSGPRPSYKSHVVDDSGANGNGDGILDPGETAILPITLRNSGDSDATSVTGELYGVGPVKVYQANASYSNVLVNQQQTSIAPHYEVTLDPSASCGDWIGANMAISGNGFNVGSGFTMDVGLYDGDRPSTDTPVIVPKSSPAGVWSYLNVPDDFIPTDVSVTLNLDHEDLTQVRVVMYHPDNSLAILHDYEPGNGIHTTYDDTTQPSVGTMETFAGKSPMGTWRIKVIDDSGCCGVPDGTIEDWTLTFTADIPWDCNPVSCGEAVPPPVGDTLTVNKSGASDVQVSWSGVGGASNYNVWRAHDNQMATAVHIGATGGSTSLIDGGAQNLSGVHYYVARSVNSCRWESD
ncbi:MAG: proprotein convertase P-domain-containing protein, partial [Acidobacteriota bacterium]|nr:proprotein convertase P-domain-containing protein [Acidobacteriota bacterium]